MKYKAIFCIVILLYSYMVYAYQTKIISDYQTVYLPISGQELNYIFLHNDAIKQVYGMEGSYLLQKDQDKGAIYLQPSALKDFPLFINTQNGHYYSLRFVPSKIPAQIIELQDKREVLKEKLENNAPEMRWIHLIQALSNQEKIKSSQVVNLPAVLEFQGWKLKLQKKYILHTEEIEVWEIENNTSNTLIFHAPAFLSQRTRAIGFSKIIFLAGEKSILYTVNSYISHAS